MPRQTSRHQVNFFLMFSLQLLRKSILQRGKPVVEGSLEKKPPFEKPSIEQVKRKEALFYWVKPMETFNLLFSSLYTSFCPVHTAQRGSLSL